MQGAGLQFPIACSLVAGFLLIRPFPFSRYYTNRQQGYALLLSVITAGLVLFVAASVVTHSAFTLQNSQYVDAEGWRRLAQNILPFPHAGKSLLTLILGVVLPVCSWIIPRDWYMNLVIELKADPLEVVLRRAFSQGRAISVTLRTGKVYVGYLHVLFNPYYDVNYIELYLTHSGYRTEAEKRLELVNDYRDKAEEIYLQRLAERVEFYRQRNLNDDFDSWFEQAQNDLREHQDVEDELSGYQVVIPISEIISVSYFEHELYEAFENTKERSDSDGTAGRTS